MSEIKNEPTYEYLFNENVLLKMKNTKLIEGIKHLRKNIQKLQDQQELDICEYFDMCKSIRETTDKFFFENVDDCFEALKEYFGCPGPLQRANDYRECYKEIFGRDCQEELEELAGEKILEDKNIFENLVVENLDVY